MLSQAASLRRVEHARYIAEKGLDDFIGRSAELEPEPELGLVPEPELVTAPAPADGKEQPVKEADGDKGKAPAGKEGHTKELGGKGEGKGAEEAAGAAPEPAPKKSVDVIVLVHLPRGNDVNFNFDFNQRWKYAFIDGLMPAAASGPSGANSASVLGSWGKAMRDAVRNTEEWTRRRAPTQDPSTNTWRLKIRVPLFVARTLNATGQSRVTLSLR